MSLKLTDKPPFTPEELIGTTVITIQNESPAIGCGVLEGFNDGLGGLPMVRDSRTLQLYCVHGIILPYTLNFYNFLSSMSEEDAYTLATWTSLIVQVVKGRFHGFINRG